MNNSHLNRSYPYCPPATVSEQSFFYTKNATVHELHHDGGIKCSIDFSFPWRTSQMHVNFVQGLHIVVTQPFDAIDHLHKSCSFLLDFSSGSYPKVTDAR